MLQDLLTETRNSASNAIDRLPTAEMLEVINQADRDVPDAVAKVIPEITRAVDAIVERMRNQGRLFYMGAGTSGRLGVLDASECPPTFNVPPDLVQGIIAGGDRALRNSVERAEDDPEQGRNDLQARGFGAGDVLVGIAASGRTPYVLGAVAYAHSLGALTVALSCTPDSELARAAEIAITPVPGPEIITGSTRMRAGTATKLVLNMISTGVMIRLGYVYGNLMVNVQPTNGKLADRARRIIAVIAGISTEDAGHLLDKAGSVRVAIVMHKFGIGRSDAEARLNAAQGRLRAALGENE
ncbi:MAG TPA: N-acetylmuramic acid 6-phosphate etherase [Bryobacteraceae bacterium]|jgi:N-acetylmuramic acid 6-phosphate etherase|nr:N-acetylmuramic acid 6-phosphate etherase [Bryobacteraceae bacterium]